jgi:hypothetical protein
LAFVDQYIGNLKQLSRHFDGCGRSRWICALTQPNCTAIFDSYGIANGFEIYSGTHTSAVADRFQNHVLPFFSKNLCFQAGCR